MGKTTFATLLSGGTLPTSYIPTVNLELVRLEGLRIGTYEMVIWDFAGSRGLFELYQNYFHGFQAVIVVTDSTLENTLVTKQVLVDFLVRKQVCSDRVCVAIANKQDLPDALSPPKVQRFLGIRSTYGLVATDLSSREASLRILEDIRREVEAKED